MFEVQFFVCGILSFAKIVKFAKISTPKVYNIKLVLGIKEDVSPRNKFCQHV